MELYGLQDEVQIVEILIDEFGAIVHPNQVGAYMLESLPFYSPRLVGDHISILSFNNVPLPDGLIEALIIHTELFPDNILIRWTQEQDLIFEARLGQLRGRIARDSLAR